MLEFGELLVHVHFAPDSRFPDDKRDVSLKVSTSTPGCMLVAEMALVPSLFLLLLTATILPHFVSRIVLYRRSIIDSSTQHAKVSNLQSLQLAENQKPSIDPTSSTTTTMLESLAVSLCEIYLLYEPLLLTSLFPM